MKKSKKITLVLLTAALMACQQEQKPKTGWEKHNVHMRGDTTAPYARTHHHGSGVGTYMLAYYVFRPYGYYSFGGGGMYGGGRYARSGYYNSNIGQTANVGRNATKSGVIRGGFGRSGMSVSS
jgi:hypothetical protein